MIIITIKIAIKIILMIINLGLTSQSDQSFWGLVLLIIIKIIIFIILVIILNLSYPSSYSF
jgi:hypothetical protein